jgi:Tol biopolymer transport system component
LSLFAPSCSPRWKAAFIVPLLVASGGVADAASSRVPAGVIVYETPAPNGSVGVAARNVETHAMRWVIKPSGNQGAAQAVVAPDGALVYVASERIDGRGQTAHYGTYRVFTVDRYGRSRGRADTENEDEVCPAWSPSGRTIIELLLDTDGQPKRFRIDTRGALVAAPLTTDLQASGLGCGGLLNDDTALISYKPPGSAHREIWSIDLNGGATSPWLRSANCDLGVPGVSRHPAHVAFMAICDRTTPSPNARKHSFTSGLWVTRANAAQPRLVVAGRYEHSRPAWSPDSQWLAYDQRSGVAFASSRIMAVRVAGGQPIPIVPSPAANPSWTTGTRDQAREVVSTDLLLGPRSASR